MEARADPPAVSVAVPTRGRRDCVERLLRALCRQSLPAESFEVIVCADGATDGTHELVVGFEARFRLAGMWQPQGGRASACNTAIRAASGEVIVLLDDDMEPTEGFLRAHRAEHPPGTRRCVVGAAPIAAGAGDPPLVRYMARKFGAHLERLGQEDHQFGVRDFYSGNASIRREVLLEVGLFDESFSSYGNEDLELAARLRRAGVTIRYSPDAAARQYYTKGFEALAHDTIAKGRTAVQFAAMHPEVRAELQFAAPDPSSRRWRSAREGLLALTSRVGAVPAVLTAATTALERVGPRRLDTLYRFLLEYFYWLGVRSAQAEQTGSRQADAPVLVD